MYFQVIHIWRGVWLVWAKQMYKNHIPSLLQGGDKWEGNWAAPQGESPCVTWYGWLCFEHRMFSEDQTSCSLKCPKLGSWWHHTVDSSSMKHLSGDTSWFKYRYTEEQDTPSVTECVWSLAKKCALNKHKWRKEWLNKWKSMTLPPPPGCSQAVTGGFQEHLSCWCNSLKGKQNSVHW